MTAPSTPDSVEKVGQYELYRVITDLEALQDGFLDRIDDLNSTLTEVDAASKLTRGNMQKLLCKSDAPWAREFGWKSLGAALTGTGMALVLVIDDQRFAPVKERLTTRKRPVVRAMVRRVRPKWLFTTQKASKSAKKRWESVPPEMRKRIMKKVSRAAARARKRRKHLGVADAIAQQA